MLGQSQSSSWHSVSLFSFFLFFFSPFLSLDDDNNKHNGHMRARLSQEETFFSWLWWVQNQGSSDTRLFFSTVFSAQIPVTDANYFLLLEIYDLFCGIHRWAISFFSSSRWDDEKQEHNGNMRARLTPVGAKLGVFWHQIPPSQSLWLQSSSYRWWPLLSSKVSRTVSTVAVGE